MIPEKDKVLLDILYFQSMLWLQVIFYLAVTADGNAVSDVRRLQNEVEVSDRSGLLPRR